MTKQESETAAAGTVRVETRATRWAIAVFALTAVGTGILHAGERVPLAGPDSIGTLAAWFAAGFAAASFGGSLWLEERLGHVPWRARLPLAKRIVDALATTLAMGMLAYLMVIAIAQLFQLGFRGLTVDPYGGGVLAGAAAAAVSYAAALAGARVTSSGLATLATLGLFMGTMASMLSSPDESWWQLHFSQLGNTDGITGYRFNLALIITGLVLTVLANYIGHDLERGIAARGASLPGLIAALSWLFAGIGLLMMVVGLVPDAVNFAVHVGAASGMVVVFGAFAYVSLSRLPGVPREFAAFTAIVVLGIIASVVLWIPIGYYNLTGMEFIAAGLLFAWLTVFVRMSAAYALPAREIVEGARA